MRTKDSLTPSLTTVDVALSLLLYVIAYSVIFGAGLWLMRRIVLQGLAPDVSGTDRDALAPSAPPPAIASRAARPLSALSADGQGAAGDADVGPAPTDAPR
jgi:cytochrome d ubiquinol oxidase subunit I